MLDLFFPLSASPRIRNGLVFTYMIKKKIACRRFGMRHSLIGITSQLSAGDGDGFLTGKASGVICDPPQRRLAGCWQWCSNTGRYVVQ
jgi:hypothetical protein